jgi:hypothetical protein
MSPAEIAEKVVTMSPTTHGEPDREFVVQFWDDWMLENPSNAIQVAECNKAGAILLVYERQKLIEGLVTEILKTCKRTIRTADIVELSDETRMQIIAAIEQQFALSPHN